MVDAGKRVRPATFEYIVKDVKIYGGSAPSLELLRTWIPDGRRAGWWVP